MKYDVLIIGAGPAGLNAGRRLCRAGISTLIVDSKTIIGEPKNCAEGLTISDLVELGIKPRSSWIDMQFDRAKVYRPDGQSVIFSFADRPKLVINRKIFEQELANEVINHSGIIQMKTRITKIVRDKIYYAVDEDGNRISAAVIIIAEGATGHLSEKFIAPPGPDDLLVCYQEVIDDLTLTNELGLYFGSIAPGGYAWVFPKSKTKANVGLGVKKSSNASPRKLFNSFISSKPYLKGTRVSSCGGIVPILPQKRLHFDNVLFAGDCGGCVNPLHGGGITLGMKSGEIAADTIISNIEKIKKYSYACLKTYSEKWMQKKGKKLYALYKVQRLWNHLSDTDKNDLMKSFTTKEINELYNASNKRRFIMLGKKMPRLYKIALKWL